LIQESIEGYLDRESFGSCGDVDKVLRQMVVDTTPFKSFYADLDRMMKRRHRIVHGADLLIPKDGAISPWTIADYFHLVLWNLAVLAFYSLLAYRSTRLTSYSLGTLQGGLRPSSLRVKHVKKCSPC
jgi:hypothetical protein